MRRRAFLGRTLLGGAALTVADPAVFAAGRAAAGEGATAPALPRGGRILFQGDSITDGGRWKHSDDPNHKYGQSYPYLLAARCNGRFPDGGWTFLNRGISGNTVCDLAERWDTDTLALKPDLLSVLIGANDTLGRFDPSMRTAQPVKEYAQTYDDLLDRTRKALPAVRLVLCAPFTLPGARNKDHWKAFREDIAGRQAVVRDLARKYGAALVELQPILDAACKRAPPTHWIWDGVHPTPAGHELLADHWMTVVNAARNRTA